MTDTDTEKLDSTSQPRLRRKARTGLSRRLSTVTAGVLLCGTICLTSRPAHAIDPATVMMVIGYVKQAYDTYKSLSGMLGGGGLTLAQQLQQVQEKIIGEMRSQRNAALQAQTRSVFTLFRNLSDNQRGDPTNAGLWTNLITLQQETADQMFSIATQGDAASRYELAPAYNALIATGAGVLRIKGEIWPSYPSSWNDFYLWLQPGVQGNYSMVGSQIHECYPGFNPGYSPPPNNITSFNQWIARMKPGKYRQSALWNAMEGPRLHTVGTALRTCFGVPGSTAVVSYLCSPTRCPGIAGCQLTHLTTACTSSGKTGTECAAELAKPHFDADPMVKIIRAGSVGIQTLSGGNDYDAPNNNWLLAQGKFVDPWVDEASCGASGPWAYPHVP